MVSPCVRRSALFPHCPEQLLRLHRHGCDFDPLRRSKLSTTVGISRLKV